MIYIANVFQDINDKKEIVVEIQMLNFYLKEALKKEFDINNYSDYKFENNTNN